MSFSEGYKYLNKHRNKLSKQQYKTFLGQMKNGNIDGMIKGLSKIIKE